MRASHPVALAFVIASMVIVASCQHKYRADDDGRGDGGASDLGGVPCTGLACRVNYGCPVGGHTTISGTVFAPNGTLPLYNATVYVPNGAVEPFPTGVTCDRCDGKLTGDPIAKALTGPDGSFRLVDVPSGADVPLVVQLGRWRRRTTVKVVVDCHENEIVDTSVTRLPKNTAEGEIPRMAIATGNADPFECLLLKVGIDAKEITAPSSTTPGRIDFYRATNAPGTDLASPAPRADTLYTSISKLLTYDVLMLPCEGGAFDKSQVDGKPLAIDPRPLLAQYLDAGGRVFATHLSYDWFTYAGSPYNKLAAPVNATGQWPVGQADDYNNTIHAPLITSFPKGADFAKWLGFAGASSQPNTLDIAQGRHDLTAVDPAFAQPWVTYNFSATGGGASVMHFTANMPLSPPVDDMGRPQYCGRTVFSDFHVTANALQSASLPFPVACKSEPMTDQEKALAFMLFDLSSCVQDDSIAPIL